MLSTFSAYRRIVTVFPKINTNLTPTRTYKVTKREECDAHMNELPVPCGPWEPWYNAKQSFYNKVFVFGVLWFIFSGVMMFYTESIYFNFSPPARPGPPSDRHVTDCEEEPE